MRKSSWRWECCRGIAFRDDSLVRFSFLAVVAVSGKALHADYPRNSHSHKRLLMSGFCNLSRNSNSHDDEKRGVIRCRLSAVVLGSVRVI